MFRKTIKYAAIIFAVAVFLVSCQKEDEKPAGSNTDDILGKRVYSEISYNVLKGATVIKNDTVWVMQNDGITFIPHRTMKIRTLNWSKIQEWFLDDLRTDVFEGSSFYPGDTDGAVHGTYYTWSQVTDVQDGINGGWETIVYTDGTNYLGVEGFRIPKYSNSYQGEIDVLASMLGSTSLIKNKIQLANDNLLMNGSTPIGNSAWGSILYDVRGTVMASSQWTGCPAMAAWDGTNNNSFFLWFPNASGLQGNIRLVRTITQSQW